MNKKNVVYVVIVLVIIVTIFYFINLPKYNGGQTNQGQTPTSETSSNASNNISIANFSFNPQVLNIHKGDTVVWTNKDSVPHHVVGGSFNGPVMSNGQNYSFTFDAIGTFDYHCAIHPFMTGTIIVQ